MILQVHDELLFEAPHDEMVSVLRRRLPLSPGRG